MTNLARLLLPAMLSAVLLLPVFDFLDSAAEALPVGERPAYLSYVPPASRRPAPVLLVLHGHGDRGAVFSAPLLARAQAEGWVLAAPTFEYGDWRNPTQVAREDTLLVQQLRDLIRRLPQETGIRVEPRVLLYGFSRGAQLAHRFALVYPELVRGVAILSAGTYTLPLESMRLEEGAIALDWPYGCADFAARFGHRLNRDQLQAVPFLVGVGELDSNSADLPRQWDRFVGRTRVERASAFAGALAKLGVPTRLVVFPREGHAAAGLARATVLDFLARILYLDDEPNPLYDRVLQV
ncbi:MAG: hypothetical protein HY690_16775 [Chloroflexi bacterium]|nr:hypothetical protein [Chloroflexota bacterium]